MTWISDHATGWIWSRKKISSMLSDHLGGLVLKEEQKLAVEALLSGKDVMAVLPLVLGNRSYIKAS